MTGEVVGIYVGYSMSYTINEITQIHIHVCTCMTGEVVGIYVGYSMSYTINEITQIHIHVRTCMLH